MTEQELVEAGVIEFESDGTPYIVHRPGKLPEIADALVYYLGRADCLDVFTRSGGLAKIYRNEEKTPGVRRSEGAVIIHPIRPQHLREILGRAVKHKKFDSRKGELVMTDCSRAAADTVIERGHFTGIRNLEGFIEAPTITMDGRIIDRPGWDEETGLYLAPNEIADYQRPLSMTKEAAKKAADWLISLFRTFPFVSDSDRCAMLSAVLTAIVRRLLPAAPLILITAPTPGTGKTKLSDAIAITATGKKASVIALGQDDAETEKRLGGVLMAGDMVILIDNVEGYLRGTFLCQIATQHSVRYRPMGTSGMLSVPTNSVVIANGNNLTLLGDIQRRVMSIWLDAKTERPELRQFERDFLVDISNNRGRIITAALTIIGAYIDAGKPIINGLAAFGSFEDWDSMCRRPLVWLGLPDPLSSAEALRDQDPDVETMRMVMSAWNAKYGGAELRLSEVIDSGMARIGDVYQNPDLYEALQLACSEKPNSRRLGIWLRQRRGRIVDGFQFMKSGMDGHGKVAKWRLVAAGNTGNSG